MRKAALLALSAAFLLAACARDVRYARTGRPAPKRLVILPEGAKDPTLRPYEVNGERYYPLPDSEGFVQVGLASWYGKKFHGRPTASGEIFDMYRKSAAHKILPMGTCVRVMNQSNGKEVTLKINDRGPFVKGRIIDLSYAAARQIALVGPGVARVKVVALGKQVGRLDSPTGPKPVVEVGDFTVGEFAVQVGAFKDRNNALRLADRLKVIFDHVDISVYADEKRGSLYRLRVSRSRTLSQAGKIEKRLEEMGFKGAFIVRL
jgi:rare lipoprotein A